MIKLVIGEAIAYKIFIISGKPPPRLPRYMIQKAWGMPSTLLDKYIDLDEHGHCIIGGDKCLSVSLFFMCTHVHTCQHILLKILMQANWGINLIFRGNWKFGLKNLK